MRIYNMVLMMNVFERYFGTYKFQYETLIIKNIFINIIICL